MTSALGVRPSQLAGQWYPASPKRLTEEVDGYINAAELDPLGGEVIAIMTPHAGYMYSGSVAGYAFSSIKDQAPNLVVVISPMHQPYFAPVMTTAHSAYNTPLGEAPVNRDVANLFSSILEKETGVTLVEISNDTEHSLEIELPFLQRAIKGPFQLLPIMLRDQSMTMARNLAEALFKTISKIGLDKPGATIFVASTDLSHYYSQSKAKLLDAEILKKVAALDPEGVIRVEEQGKGYACGRGALATVIWIAKLLGATKSKILKYATSGDASGNYDRVVGYAAAVFLR